MLPAVSIDRAFMAADGCLFPVPSSSPQHTHTLILRGKARRPGTTGRTHHHDRGCFLMSRLIAPQQTISHWAATDNITGLGRNVGHQFSLPELMHCLAPAPTSNRPSRVDAMPRPDGRLVRLLSSLQRPSRVDSMLHFGGSRPSSWSVFPS